MSHSGLKLVFFDTFSHERGENVNIDLVKFAPGCPVVVREIRIIPSNTCVSIEPGIYSQGCTSPASFCLEIFVNNLSRTAACTFERLHSLEYRADGEIKFVPVLPIATDGLLIRGPYHSITLAIYGEPTQDDQIPQPSFIASTVSPTQISAPPPTRPMRMVVPPPAVPAQPFQPSWPAAPPIPELPRGVAHFNPSIPPPNAAIVNPYVSNAPVLIPPPAMPPQPIPTIGGGYPKIQPFDVSRPPPSLPGDQQQSSPSKEKPLASANLAPARKKIKKEKDEENFAGKPIETIGSVKMGGGSLNVHSGLATVNEIALEEGEYANSDDENDKFNFETEVISDDEYEFEGDDVDFAELREDLLKDARFNIHNFELTPLIHFKPPHLSEFQIEKRQMHAKYVDVEMPSLVLDTFNSMDEIGEERNSNTSSTGFLYNKSFDSFVDFLPKVIGYVFDGLDVNLAMKQEMSAFIVRHIKAGLKLADVLIKCDSSIAEQLLTLDVQHKLLDVFVAKHMSVPLKLQILKTLDSSLFFPIGFRTMVNADVGHLSSYQRLTSFLLDKTGSRIAVAIQAILRKVHFYQRLCLFSSLIEQFALEDEVNNLDETVEPISCPVEVDKIVDLLHEILTIYKNAESILVQPPFGFPASVIFELPKPNDNPYPSIFQYFISERFLECLLLLLTSRRTNGEMRVVNGIATFFNELLKSNDGILFLETQVDVTKEFLRLSVQGEDDMHDDDSVVLQNLGAEVTYHLHALHLIDELMHYHSSGVVQLEVDNPGVLSTLQSFYVLTLDQQSNDNLGRRAVVRVLSYDNNLNAILPFVEHTSDEEWDNKMKKSACAGYATELLLLVLRFSDSVELLKNFGDKLLAISCEDAGSKIVDVKHWTDVLRKLSSFSTESIEYLCEKVKYFVLQEGVTPKVPKGLITVLRILKYLVVPQNEESQELEKTEELKHKYALMQMHSFEILPLLIQIIDKLAEFHMINWQQGISLNSHFGSLFYACVLPTLSLIRISLSYLALCRGSEYHDVSAIGALMKMYIVCCSMLPSTGVAAESHAVRTEIIGSLLTFTQPDIGDKLSDVKDDSFEVVSKSLWTRAVDCILNLTTESPYSFVAGLGILSELLPLPLPVLTKEALSVSEIQVIESKRRLWSAHLLPLSTSLQQIVRDTTPTTHTNLQHCLRRVCVQLCDLSSPIANVVARAILTVVVENAETLTVDKDNNVDQRRLGLPASSGLSFSLNLLSYLSAHGPFKIVMIDLLRSRTEAAGIESEGFSQLLSYFVEIFNFVSSASSHLVCQEHIVSIFQSLCDEDIGLVACDKSTTIEQIASSLPEATQLRQMCVSLLKHIGCKNQSYATVLPSLRIFVMMCEHDYGLYNIKMALEVERKALLSLFQRLLSEFSGHSSDCLSTLSTFVELMKLLHSPASSSADTTKPELKRSSLGVDFVREILEWQVGDNSNAEHPLNKLSQLLEISSKEDDALASMFSNVQKLINVLSDSKLGDTDKFLEPILPAPLDVRSQFNQRQVWSLITDDDEDRLTAHYWYPHYTLESEDGDVEKVECDLETICSQYFPQFNVADELKRKYASKRSDDVAEPVPKNKPSYIDTSSGVFKAAPIRGRPRPTGYGNRPPPRSIDPFRNRPPNTSRPPSMHVDDFIIAESQTTSMGGDEDKQMIGMGKHGINRFTAWKNSERSIKKQHFHKKQK